MAKIFFFYRRDRQTGEIVKDKDKIIECNELTAWACWTDPRHYKYIGWSDGRFIREAKKKVGRRREIDEHPTSDEVKIVKEAVEKEIEFAENNPDKTPPRNPTKIGYPGREPLDAKMRDYLSRLR